MCFTVNVNLVKEELENRFGATFLDPENYTPSYYYHAFGLPKLPVICSEDTKIIRLLRWGLIPSWVKSGTEARDIQFKTFNARAESLSEKRSFSVSLSTKRCLIPVKGFYEWQHVSEEKIPWYIYRCDNDVITFAGLWDEWMENNTGEKYSTFSIITTEANELLEKIHNSAKRMPVILDKGNEHKWLDLSIPPEEIRSLLKPCKSEYLKAHTISDLINDKSKDRNTPDLIIPFERHISGTLFN